MSELASPPSGAAALRRMAAARVGAEPERAAGPAAAAKDVETTTAVTGAPAAPQAEPAAEVTGPSSGSLAGILLIDRYRLRTRIGSDITAGAEFWRAEDVVLQRDVAVTVLRRLAPHHGELDGGALVGETPHADDDPAGAMRAGEMMVRALRSGSFEHTGCARLLDVMAPGTAGIPRDVLGAAVTEWVPGRSLAEVVADGLIKPLAAARAVLPLAAAAEAAHRLGLVLGCDHPQRVRITPDGGAQLCFALPRPNVTPADDVRGLGAVLYTLLTSHWPLSPIDAARAGLGAADRTTRGTPVPPSHERPGVPVELDAITRGALGPEGEPGHVHTAAAVRSLLTEVIVEDDRFALFPPEHDGAPSDAGDVWQDRGRPSAPPDPRRRRKLAVGLIVLAAAVLVVLGYVGLQLRSAFVEAGGPAIVVGGTVGPSDAAPNAARGVGGIAAVAGVEVYDDVGDRDNAGRVSRVIDGSTDSGWRTFTYQQQFPALKPGVGIMVSFASAVQLSDFAIESSSPGTVVEVRSAPAVESPLAETTLITEVTLTDGVTPASLAGSQPVTHVLLWITELGGVAGEHATEISEVAFRRAGP